MAKIAVFDQFDAAFFCWYFNFQDAFFCEGRSSAHRYGNIANPWEACRCIASRKFNRNVWNLSRILLILSNEILDNSFPPDMILLQGTRLVAVQPYSLPGLQIFKLDKPEGRCGALVVLLSCHYRILRQLLSNMLLQIAISWFYFFVFPERLRYIELRVHFPKSFMTSATIDPLLPLNHNDFVTVGDLNLHHISRHFWSDTLRVDILFLYNFSQ